MGQLIATIEAQPAVLWSGFSGSLFDDLLAWTKSVRGTCLNPSTTTGKILQLPEVQPLLYGQPCPWCGVMGPFWQHHSQHYTDGIHLARKTRIYIALNKKPGGHEGSLETSTFWRIETEILGRAWRVSPDWDPTITILDVTQNCVHIKPMVTDKMNKEAGGRTINIQCQDCSSLRACAQRRQPLANATESQLAIWQDQQLDRSIQPIYDENVTEDLKLHAMKCDEMGVGKCGENCSCMPPLGKGGCNQALEDTLQIGFTWKEVRYRYIAVRNKSKKRKNKAQIICLTTKERTGTGVRIMWNNSNNVNMTFLQFPMMSNFSLDVLQELAENATGLDAKDFLIQNDGKTLPPGTIVKDLELPHKLHRFCAEPAPASKCWRRALHRLRWVTERLNEGG